MAATAWALYYSANEKLGKGDFALDTATFRLGLYKSAGAGEADTLTLSNQTQLSNQCTGGAYTANGETLTGTTWSATATSVMKFDSDNLIITASGSAITSIKHAVILQSLSATGGHLLCFSQLSSSVISVGTGNTITIEMNASGIFTLA